MLGEKVHIVLVVERSATLSNFTPSLPASLQGKREAFLQLIGKMAALLGRWPGAATSCTPSWLKSLEVLPAAFAPLKLCRCALQGPAVCSPTLFSSELIKHCIGSIHVMPAVPNCTTLQLQAHPVARSLELPRLLCLQVGPLTT